MINRFPKLFLTFLMIWPLPNALLGRPGLAPERFAIVAARFSFHPDQITVRKATPVILDLTSKDVTHGLKCKEFGFNVTIHKGKTTEVKFTPDETGRFVGRCSHFCGMGHGSMTFVINVTDK